MNFLKDFRNSANQIEADVRSGERVFKHGILVRKDTRVVAFPDGSGYSVVQS